MRRGLTGIIIIELIVIVRILKNKWASFKVNSILSSLKVVVVTNRVINMLLRELRKRKMIIMMMNRRILSICNSRKIIKSSSNSNRMNYYAYLGRSRSILKRNRDYLSRPSVRGWQM